MRWLAIMILVALGSGCGAECSDLSPRECAERSDCSMARMWVSDKKGKREKVACINRR